MKSITKEDIKEVDIHWTPQRRVIFSVIANSEKKHLSSEEIYRMSKKIMPSIGLATIYRTLELFCKKGILQKINLPDEPAMFEIINGNSDHCHYVCLRCGKIFELPEQKGLSLPGVDDENIKDFTVTAKSCWYFGYCKNCKNKEEVE